MGAIYCRIEWIVVAVEQDKLRCRQGLSMTSFHADTFLLLREEPPLSTKATLEVEQTEKRLGLCLPASVRDWYSHDGAIEILAKHSNQDPPIPLVDFELIHWKGHRLLPFRVENQGVCIWSVMLDGSDDPPVYVDVDSNGQEWTFLAPTFSAHVNTCVWDYTAVFDKPAVAQAQNTPLSELALSALRLHFAEKLTTFGWPACSQYRFAGDGQGILIWAAEEQADWFVAGSDDKSLESALRVIWELDDVGKSLYDCSPMAGEVLQRLRGQS